MLPPLRICARCSALAQPLLIAGNSSRFGCTGCKRTFAIIPTFVLVLQGLGVALCLGIIGMVGIKAGQLILAFGAAFPAAVLALGINNRVKNPLADPETIAILERAWADPLVASVLRGERTMADLAETMRARVDDARPAQGHFPKMDA